MMRLTRTRARATSAAHTPLKLTAGRSAASFIGAVADPQVRLGAGAVALLVTALAVRRDQVSPGEGKIFHAINDLPDAFHHKSFHCHSPRQLCRVSLFGAIVEKS